MQGAGYLRSGRTLRKRPFPVQFAVRILMNWIALAATTAGSASADDFNWGPNLGTINTGSGSYTLNNGLGFTSPMEDQGQWGTCWDFAAIAALESKYKLTRNDTAYSIDLSEEQDPMLLGGTYDNFANGGWPSSVMNQVVYGGGIVQASELPYNAYGSYLPPTGDWPLKPGWQNRAVVSTSWSDISASPATLKTDLKTYGPGVICIDAGTFFYYPNGSSSQDATGTAGVGIDHCVSVVGYHDATTADDAAIKAAGGYWIIKNSWGNWWNYGGYCFVPYNLITDISFYTGPAYYTGALATATWQGSSGTWAAGGTNWTSSGSAYSWANQETAAVFNASANNAITISGPAIAHALVFNTGATGYSFSGGTLTVTAGGIAANESVTINSPVTIGAPQTWATAAGKTLTVNGNVSTVVSTLTVAGSGGTVINGVVGNGGAMLGTGGGLTMQGPGTLYLTSSNTYSGATTVSGGLLDLSGSGAIGSSSGLSVLGGTLLLDNSLNNNASRIPNAIGVTLGGGEMALTGNTAGTVQTIGPLALQTGNSILTVAASGSAAQMSFGACTRTIGGTALLRGSSLGTAGSGSVGQITFSTSPTLSNSGTGAQIGILPYFYGDNSPTGSGTDLVTYGSNGLRLLASSEYSASLAASTNVKLTASATAAGSLSILSLVLSDSGTGVQATIPSSQTLTLSSGALLSTGSVANTVSGGTLTFGSNAATAYEGIIHAAGDLAIGSAIANNGSHAVLLTKSGPGTLTLTGTDTYSGGTYVSGGTLQVAAGGAVVSGGALNIGGNAPALNVSGGTVSTGASGNAVYLGGLAGQTGVVNVSAGNFTSSYAGASNILGNYGTGLWNQTGGTSSFASALTGANQAGSAAQMNFSGGSINAASDILVAQGGAGTLNLSGPCAVSTPWLAMVGWTSSFATCTVNLGGGTLAVGTVAETCSGQTASGLATFDFNGGLLRATASNTSFLQGLDYAYVQSGGAVIDTQGYSDTIGQALLSYAGTSSGGLTKLGSGLLTLTASNTYTGLTTVSGGTLQLGDGVSNNGSVGGGIFLANGSTLVFANPAALAYASGITGSGSLLACGAGTLTLSGTNTYNGTTTLNAGLLVFSNTGSLPAGSIVTINNGAALAATAIYTPAGWLSNGVIAASSSGALALTASCAQNLNFQSPTTYAGLALGSVGNNTYSGTLTPVGTTYRLGGGGGTLTMTQPLAGGNNLVVSGPGGVALANTASLSLGSLQINTSAGAASLQLAGVAYSTGSLANTGTGAASLTLGNAATGTATILTIGGDNSSSTFGAAIGDLETVKAAATGSLVKTGSGTLVLTGSSTYSGPTAVNGGVLRVPGNNLLPGATALTISASATLDVAGGNQQLASLGDYSPGVGGSVINGTTNTTSALTLSPSGGSTTFSGQILGGGTLGTLGLVKTGSGTQVLAGANTYMGGTTVSGGVLRAGSSLALGSASAGLTTSGGTLDLNNYSLTVGSLAGYAGTILSSAGATSVLTVNQASGTCTYGGALVNGGGTLALTKSGAGTLLLTGSNTYSGPTAVNGGKISFGGSPIVSTANISVGGTTAPGSYSLTGQTLTITGAGGDFWGSTEQGYYVYDSVPTNANFDVAVHIASMSGGDASWAKAGIMARQDASNNNVNTVFNEQTTGSGVTLQLTNSSEYSEVGGVVAPTWLRMTYTASTSTFTGYYSSSTSSTPPTSWSSDGSYTATMSGSSFLLGIADTAHNNSLTDTAVFDNLGSLFPIGAPTNVLPVTTALSIAAGARLDLSGGNQQVASLAGYGSVTNSSTSAAVAFTVGDSTSTTFSGTISDSGAAGALSLAKIGAGTLTLAGSNSYTGSTAINAGTLSLGSSAALAGAGNITFGGGALQFSVNNAADYSGRIKNSTAAITIDTNNQSVTFASALDGSNTGGLTKVGAGTLTLTASSSYTGPTAINSGALALSATACLSNTALQIATGGLFTVNPGSGTILAGLTSAGSNGSTLNLALGGRFNMTGDNAVGVFDLNQQAGFSGVALTLGGGTLSFDLSATGADELVVNKGTAAVPSLNTISFDGLGGSLTPSSTYTLISDPAGGLNSANFALGSSTIAVGASTYALQLTGDAQHEAVIVSAATHPGIGAIVATPTYPSIITGGSTGFTFTVANSGTSTLNFSASAGANTAGGPIGPFAVSSGSTSAAASGLSFNGTTVGPGQIGSFSVSDSAAGNSPQTGTVTVNVLDHSNPALSIVGGNNQTVIVGATSISASLNLSNAGSNRAPLDVNGLVGLSGSSGTAVVASGGTAGYIAALNTGSVGLAQTDTVSLNAGDQQALPGHASLGTLSQNVILNVLDHSNPALSIVGGNNQTVIVGATSISASLNLCNSGSNRAPLDVNSLMGLTGSSGTAMVASGGTAAYVAALNTGSVGLAQTDTVSLNAGDQQALPGHASLGTLSQNVILNVLDHSNPALNIVGGNNQTVIVGATSISASLNLSNAGSNRAPLDVNSLVGLTGSSGTAVVASGGTAGYVAAMNTGSVGLAQTDTVSLNAGDQQALPGHASLGTLSQNVILNVYGHAAGSASGTIIALPSVHVGYVGSLLGTTSAIVTNTSLSDYQVNLKTLGTTMAGNLAINNISGIAPGCSAAIGATLAAGQAAGPINQSFTLNYADDSGLPGASSNLGSLVITVTGNICSGQGAWNRSSCGSWTCAGNWTTCGGVPGIDGVLSANDTATFGNVIGSNSAAVTLDTPVTVAAVTFDNAAAGYTLCGSNALTLNNSGGGATITVAAGSHVINVPVVLADNLTVTGSGTLAFGSSSGITGSGSALTMSGAGGTLILGGTSTCAGGTTITAGVLQVDNHATLGPGTAPLAVNGGTLIVNPGGLVDVASTITDNNGCICLNGGTLRTSTIGGQPMAFNMGTLEYKNNLGVSASDWLESTLGPGRPIGFAQQLKVDGTTTLNDVLTVSGGTFSTGSLVNPSLLQFNSGTFNLTGDNLSISGTGALGGALALPSGNVVNVTNNASIAAGASLTMQGGGFSAATLTNSGAIGGSGQINAPLTNAPGGLVRALASDHAIFTGGNNVNQGQIQLCGGAVEFTGALTNGAPGTLGPGGLITGYGSLIVSGGLLNSGSMALSGVTNITGTVNNGPSGLVDTAGGTTSFWGNVVNNGTVYSNSDAFTVFYGAVSGSGSFTGPGTASFEGNLSPGQTPAAIAVASQAYFANTSQINIALAGTTAGTQYDQVNVAGAATLSGGSLNVTLLNGFRPAQNAQFTVLTFGSRSGNFATESGLNLGGRLQLVPAYTANSLVLTAVQGGSGAWRFDTDGAASVSTNWTGGIPGAAGDTATFGPVITERRTVTLDEPTVVGAIVLDSPCGYTLSGAPGTPVYPLADGGANALTLNNSGSGATITVSDGQQAIDAPVVLADNLVVTGSGTLTFGGSSSIAETGGSRSLTMSGAGGMLILSGTDSYTGGTNVDAGTLCVVNCSAIADGTRLTVGAGGMFVYDPSAAGTPSANSSPSLVVAPVPEPRSIALLLAALGSAIIYRRFSSRPNTFVARRIGNPSY